MKQPLPLLYLLLLLYGCTPLVEQSSGWDLTQRVDLHTRLGLGYMEQDRLAAALESLQYALSLASDDSTANHAMALLQLRLGDSNAARSHFETALIAEHGNVAARNDFGSYLCEKGAAREGIAQFRQALKDPFNTRPYLSQYGLAVCLTRTGELKSAREYLGRALAAQPESGPILYQSAVVGYGLGNHLSARGFLERFFGLGLTSPESLLLATRNEQKLGAVDLVGQYATRLRKGYPSSTQAAQLDAVLRGGS
ncbi:MAG: type IV pilus biogenesis/stability protein PilW [Arenicellales bacterium]|jgi:type IV pilus assembly protein PilF|nr:type IV pilus biogenesis/stability protein PilW [Acidiferrobacteraceae bacterium]MDP6141086.1 type IV pilus biogenesis/stability protein PilW [Arenicellales bacterium]HCV21720.1 type IV pilus biogenesis/stability protein PilW [Gammaproteobacteria bacterium]MDP6312861.1 type IV pilus biogenesis/stability protein PilW [Arenicellales bacterium]MDP7120561.1 type IV pilus biogenesis/stability protein PilW [Arenicellales bacterium]|tara:strand:+ start:348 stop:1106 length:759 start_codon:yes stop_codon:yes gene_type:complete